MASENSLISKIKKGIMKISSRQPDAQPKALGSEYKIKYNASQEELEGLGLVDEFGTVIDRNRFNVYMAVVQHRREVQALPDFERLKKAGVVDENGEVLDSKKYQEYTNHLFNLRYANRDKTM